jgi:pyrimidine operon attenuation protein/uracil phosphoribosyltransferase
VAAHVDAGCVLLDTEALNRTIARIAHEIVEANTDLASVALVGIQTRGVPLAQRLRRLIADFGGVEIALGSVDFTATTSLSAAASVRFMPSPSSRRRSSISRSRA